MTLRVLPNLHFALSRIYAYRGFLFGTMNSPCGGTPAKYIFGSSKAFINYASHAYGRCASIIFPMIAKAIY